MAFGFYSMFNIANILGFSSKGSHESAHETHHNTIVYDQNGQAQHVITKLNKHKGLLGEQASKLEACFTAIANLLFAPKRVMRQEIVLNKERVVGVSTEHIAHLLLRLQNKGLVLLKPPSALLSIAEMDYEKDFKPYLEVSPNGFQQIAVDPAKRDEFRKRYLARLDNYWKERKRLGHEEIDLDQIAYFTGLIEGFIQRNIGFEEFLASDEMSGIDEITGISKELLQEIYEREQFKRKCQEQIETNVDQAMEIDALRNGDGFNFLENLPRNFFANLLKAKNEGLVTIDMDSLADVFGVSYGIEEDDLHGGNIYVYVTLEEGKPRFHFGKIDNDLAYNDKLMASRGVRFANLGYKVHQFAVSKRDLHGFPDIQDSGNHYWPTKKALLSRTKTGYHNESEREAYKSLKDDEDFKKAKWMRFLKQAVIPNDLIRATLRLTMAGVGSEDEQENIIATVQRAATARNCEMRAALLGLPAFREFIRKKDNFKDARDLILDELKQHAESLELDEKVILAYEREVEGLLNSIQKIAEEKSIDEKNNLRIVILSGSYRCYETASYYKDLLDRVDADNKTALDEAIDCYEHYRQQKPSPEGLKMVVYYADVICDLMQHNAKSAIKEDWQLEQLQEQAEQDSFKAQIAGILDIKDTVITLDEFKEKLIELRKQPMHTLKEDKVYALALLDKVNLSYDDLIKLKAAIEPTEPEAPFTFIKELRSELWIVRKIRGAYGFTTTSSEMEDCINEKLYKLEHNEDDSSCCLHVF